MACLGGGALVVLCVVRLLDELSVVVYVVETVFVVVVYVMMQKRLC